MEQQQMLSLVILVFNSYHYDPMFSDRQAWTNSVDQNQTAPRGVV